MAEHEPGKGSIILGDLLRDEGFEVTIDNTTASFADPGLAQFSLIVPIVTMSTIEKIGIDNLEAAVRSGVGLAGYHGGMGDSFRNEVKFQYMVSGQWVAHPGNIIDYSVNITRPDDAVMAGINDFSYHSEQYYMHVDPNNEVLANTVFTGRHNDWIAGHTCPVVWKRHHGAGRVFYSSLGHQAHEFNVPEMATIMRRGMAWAAR